MSNGSSSAADWLTRLEPAARPADLPRRPDDPRLGEIVQFGLGDLSELTPGRAVLIGFPQDEGVRRNHGRPGAAEAPDEIRRYLYRLTAGDAASDIDLSQPPPVDLGNLRVEGSLEETQQALAQVVATALERGAVPVVLGGGHETAYGHFLGYAQLRRPVGIINLDAHLDVRPTLKGLGHSGSPFRQALEHAGHPLPGPNYVCLGAQPHSVSRQHRQYAQERGCAVLWRLELISSLDEQFRRQCERLGGLGCHIYVSLDADVVDAADVPAVSAPNPGGLPGELVLRLARLAGRIAQVASFDLVEIIPRLDRDGQSARWAALAVWNFLIGLMERQPMNS